MANGVLKPGRVRFQRRPLWFLAVIPVLGAAVLVVSLAQHWPLPPGEGRALAWGLVVPFVFALVMALWGGLVAANWAIALSMTLFPLLLAFLYRHDPAWLAANAGQILGAGLGASLGELVSRRVFGIETNEAPRFARANSGAAGVSIMDRFVVRLPDGGMRTLALGDGGRGEALLQLGEGGRCVLSISPNLGVEPSPFRLVVQAQDPPQGRVRVSHGQTSTVVKAKFTINLEQARAAMRDGMEDGVLPSTLRWDDHPGRSRGAATLWSQTLSHSEKEKRKRARG